MNASFLQTKVDSKHVVYDIPAAEFSKLDILPVGMTAPFAASIPLR
jgi:hypothetical protein